MKTRPSVSTAGNTLLLALGTIVILSAVGANVLSNLTTRYNVSNNQVRGWKQAQHAAEAAGDIAYAEVRKAALDPANSIFEPTGKVCAEKGWTVNGDTYTSPATTVGPDSLVVSSTVDKFYDDANGNPWYRIRAKGTVPLRGLKRVGMDDRMGPNTRGDSLLRKIDFTYDHFIAAYGPNGDGVGKAIVPVASPQLTRRIELIASPLTPFEAAIKAQGSFYGLGNAARIDSYDSDKGPYYFAATSPGDPRYADSRSGHVQIGTGVAEVRGTLYGNLATNGGTVVRSSYVSGTVDNNVPFNLPRYNMPIMDMMPQAQPTSVNGVKTLDPPATGSPSEPIYYLLAEYGVDAKVTVVPFNNQPTYVAIRITNDFRGAITVEPNVRVQVYFEGSMIVKQAGDILNKSGKAGNLQFYGISPPEGSSIVQTIQIPPPGNFACTIYAPSANYTMNGNPDVTGALVCNAFYGNGNTMWHYDRALNRLGNPVDYRIASYVEDIR